MNSLRSFGPGALEADPPWPMEGSFPRTALPVVQGVPRHLDAHLQRLEAGASALGRPADWLPGLRSGLEAWLRSSLSGEDAALRMVLNLDQGVLCAKLEALPAAPKPCRLALMPHPLGARRADPRIVHKGLAGPWSAGILAKARAQGAEDALLSWPDGSLAETAIASIGIQIGQTLLMPPSPGRVASVAERLDLPIWAQARGLRIEQEILSLAQARAGQLWCLNALRGVWPATLL